MHALIYAIIYKPAIGTINNTQWSREFGVRVWARTAFGDVQISAPVL